MVDIKDLKLEFLGHSGFLIVTKEGKRIAIDPYNVPQTVEKADFILITHTHYDHCSIKDIETLAKKGTTVVLPADAQSKAMKVEGISTQIVEPGDEIQLNGTIKLAVLPAYNIDKEFHPKSEGWLGYVVKVNDVVIYHAGDSDSIPEMNKLTGYGKKGKEFVVLLPVSGKYVMDPDQASEVANLLSPTLAVPMHYGEGVAGERADAERFVQLCKELGIHAEILEKI